jgi:hypothetical protein
MIRVVTQNLRKGERIDHHRRGPRSTGKPAKAHRGSEHPSVSAAMNSVGADRPRPNGFNSCPGHRESPGRLTHSCLGLRRPLAQLPVSGGCEAFVRAIVVAIDAPPNSASDSTPGRLLSSERSGFPPTRPLGGYRRFDVGIQARLCYRPTTRAERGARSSRRVSQLFASWFRAYSHLNHQSASG